MIESKAPAGMANVKNTKQYASPGIAAVELALILPFLVLLLLGVVEVGRAAFISIAVSNAARAGVQYGAQSSGTASDNAGMIQKAKDDAQVTGMTATARYFCECSNAPGTEVSCSTGCSGSRLIEFVQVNTTVPFDSLFHYPGLPQSFTMKGKATMRVGGN